MILAFAIVIGVTAMLTVLGASDPRRRTMHYVFKPLTTLLILGLALLLPTHGGPGYRVAIAAGLLCSLAGDVFLMLPRDRFVAGLVSFLLAHVAYFTAFASGTAARHVTLGALPYVLLSGIVVALLWRGIPAALRGPVIAYVVVLAAMAGSALGRWAGAGPPGTWTAAAGGFLFVVSDTTLAWERFRRPIRMGRATTLGTYYAAQFLIAASVGG